jgi:hypothetical protein
MQYADDSWKSSPARLSWPRAHAYAIPARRLNRQIFLGSASCDARVGEHGCAGCAFVVLRLPMTGQKLPNRTSVCRPGLRNRTSLSDRWPLDRHFVGRRKLVGRFFQIKHCPSIFGPGILNSLAVINLSAGSSKSNIAP